MREEIDSQSTMPCHVRRNGWVGGGGVLLHKDTMAYGTFSLTSLLSKVRKNLEAESHLLPIENEVFGLRY